MYDYDNSGQCVARSIPEHPDCFGPPTDQHWPKKGMGGNNPAAKVVARICAGLHDAIDNGWKYQGRRWSNDVDERAGIRWFRLMDRETGEVLLETAALS